MAMKDAFVIVVLNERNDVTAVHIFHDLTKARIEMYDEVIEAKSEFNDDVTELTMDALDASIKSSNGKSYRWTIEEDYNYEED